ncbi:MAG: hypothetical protein JRJ59_00200 [Deltaproteobacteria bacterium]|nr:hypothetical protein [Deltaproteobacteria bacterium]
MDERKGSDFRDLQLTWTMNNVLGIRNFAAAPLFSLSYAQLVRAVEAVTGWPTSLWDLLRAAERAENMYRTHQGRSSRPSPDLKAVPSDFPTSSHY